MTKSRSQELAEKANEERQRCRDWLLQYMQDNHPKFLTKAELRDVALRELNVSKTSFDFGWTEAVEETGRHDWYEPLRRRLRTKIYHFPIHRRWPRRYRYRDSVLVQYLFRDLRASATTEPTNKWRLSQNPGPSQRS